MTRSVHKLFKLTKSNLPKPYLDYYERSKHPAERVHDAPPETKYLDYNQDEQSGYVYRVPDQPIHVTFPPQSESALWGNEGCVAGFEKPKRLKPRITRVWIPRLEKHTFYSDILETYINVIVTPRTIQLIDEARGFDFYILKTRVQDLQSELGRRLKYKLQLALSSDDLSDYVRLKYKDYIRPREEIEWEGLKEHEAIIKHRLMHEEASIRRPLKETLAKALIDELKIGKLEKKRVCNRCINVIVTKSTHLIFSGLHLILVLILSYKKQILTKLIMDMIDINK